LSKTSKAKVKVVAQQVIRKFGKKSQVKTSEIREDILRKLDISQKGVADSWRRFDTKYKV
jgi:hypothetical protein